MTPTISLHDQLLSNSEHLLRLGRTSEARRQLRMLLGSHVGTTIRAHAHSLLGELEFAVGRFRAARRHFAVLIGLRPYDAEACLRYADAIDADPDADPQKAWTARRRATKIDSFDSRCWTALGTSGLHIGNRKGALKAFRRAAKLRPERIETLSAIVSGFLELGRVSEARALLQAARFRQPRDTCIAALFNRFQFDCLQRKQERAHRNMRPSWPAVVLPFEGGSSNAAVEDANPVVIRVDRRSRPAPHLLRLFGRQSDPRRAN